MATYQRGETNPIMAPIASATATEIGDLLGGTASTGVAYKASAETWDTNLATTQTAFVTKFLGVAAQKKPANDDPIGNTGTNAGKIRVDQGVWRFLNPAAGTYIAGLTMVGPAKQSGNALEDQKLAVTTTQATSIGVVVGASGDTDPTWIDVFVWSRRAPQAPQ